MSLAKRVSGLEESVTLQITSRAKKMVKDGIDVVNFAAGEPDFDTPMHIKAAAMEAIKSGFTKYTPSSGTLELREAIAAKFKKDNGLEYSPLQIVVSNGAKHSLNNVFQVLCEAGDEVLIPAPYWLSYPAMVTMASAVPVTVPTSAENNFKMKKADLEKAITKKTKAIVLNSPSNPTGSVYSEKELALIAELAIKHNFYVISDEIYEKLIYGKTKHISIASLGKEIFERTITINGFSKSYAMTGWRIGYAAGPAQVMKAIGNIQSHATSNPCSISQKAALAAIAGNQACVEDMRKEFEKRRDVMVSRIQAMKNISCTKPEGAFYVLCDISKLKKGSAEVANRLLDEANIAAIPGGPFGDDNVIRFSFATGMTEIKKGMDRLEKWLKGEK